MRYAMIILIAVALLAATNCTSGNGAQSRTCSEVKPEPRPSEPKDLIREISAQEAEALANARKWVKEALDLVDQRLKQSRVSADAFGLMLRVAQFQSLTGDKAGAIKTFEQTIKQMEIQAAANGEKVDYAEIALFQAGAGLHDMAIANAAKGSDFNVLSKRNAAGNRVSFSIFDLIAQEEVDCGFYDHAVKTAQASEFLKDNTCWIVVRGCAAAGAYQQANEAATLMKDEKVAALAYVATQEAKSGDAQAARATLKQSIKVAKPGNAADCANIARVQIELGLLDDAKATLASITQDYGDAFGLLTDVAELKAVVGDKAGAADLLKKARFLISKRTPMEVPFLLCKIAMVEAKTFGNKAALDTFKQAAESANKLQRSSWTIQKIIEYKAEAGYYAEAKADAMAISNASGRDGVVKKIVEIEIGAGLYEQAKQTTAAMYQSNNFALYKNIAIAQARAGKFKEARETLKSVMEPFVNAAIPALMRLELDAGETQYVDESIVTIFQHEIAPLPRRTCEFLARTGQDKQVRDLYDKALSSADAPGLELRMAYCYAAIRGYLARVKDLKKAQ